MTSSRDDMRDREAFARLARKIAPGATLRHAWTLHGGISARVTALEIQRADGRTQKVIARQHGAADLAGNPNIAADEFALLRALHDEGLPVPEPCFVDQSRELFATPVVVVEFIEGESVLTLDAVPDLIPQLAAQLARIHQVDCSGDAFSFLPAQSDRVTAKISHRPAALDTLQDEGRIRGLLEAVWPWPQRNAPVLLHGDYWPGNILWHEGRFHGVIDWEDAAIGDPLFDLANSRLEMLWAFGSDTMRRFTDEYLLLAAIDSTHLPYWDLFAALRHISNIRAIAGDDAEAEARLRGLHRGFVAQAFERLSVR